MSGKATPNTVGRKIGVAARERVTRPDGRVWRAGGRGRSAHLVPTPDGPAVMVGSTHDVESAWPVAERRWRAVHADAPAPTGRRTWGRIELGGALSASNAEQYDYGAVEADGTLTRSFPAVIFPPPASAS